MSNIYSPLYCFSTSDWTTYNMEHFTLKIRGMLIVNNVYNLYLISSFYASHLQFSDIPPSALSHDVHSFFLHYRMVFPTANDSYKSYSRLQALHERGGPPGYWGSSINYGMSCIQRYKRAFAPERLKASPWFMNGLWLGRRAECRIANLKYVLTTYCAEWNSLGMPWACY